MDPESEKKTQEVLFGCLWQFSFPLPCMRPWPSWSLHPACTFHLQVENCFRGGCLEALRVQPGHIRYVIYIVIAGGEKPHFLHPCMTQSRQLSLTGQPVILVTAEVTVHSSAIDKELLSWKFLEAMKVQPGHIYCYYGRREIPISSIPV